MHRSEYQPFHFASTARHAESRAPLVDVVTLIASAAALLAGWIVGTTLRGFL